MWTAPARFESGESLGRRLLRYEDPARSHREHVENFVQHLADWAEKDRNTLLFSSTATWVRKKVQLEAADNRPPRRGPMCRGSAPGWCFSGSRRESCTAGKPRSLFHRQARDSGAPQLTAHSVSSRLYCNPEVLWKLNWFLRDFVPDTDLLGRDDVDKKALIGLQGVVKENTARHSPIACKDQATVLGCSLSRIPSNTAM
jgi:hypothetical protein